MDVLERLLGHDRWATGVLIEACTQLTDEQFDRSFDIGHESIHATFGHLIFNIEAWTAQMEEREIDRSDRDWSRANLQPRFERAFDAFESFALRIRNEGRLDDTFIESDLPMTYGGAILHVVLHDDEHRQEILHILHRLGIENVPEIDHALWDFVRRGLGDD